MKASIFFYFFISLFLLSNEVGFIKAKNKKKYLKLNDLARYYSYNISRKGSQVILSSKNNKIIFKKNSKLIYINGIKFYLNFGILEYKLDLYASEIDCKNVLYPQFLGKQQVFKPVRTIVIDPGHGGKDTGTYFGRLKEKDFNLRFSKLLREYLEGSGFIVYLTRNSDTYPSFKYRQELARKISADIFISIHINSSPKSRSTSGIETYRLTPPDAPSFGRRNLRSSKKPYDLWHWNNTNLALAVQENLVRYTGANDRGVKSANFVILKHPYCPSVLIELGFLSHSREAKYLFSLAYQKSLAYGITKGLIEYAETSVLGRLRRKRF